MNKIKRLLQFAFIVILFNVLLFYIGWNGWEWLNISFGRKILILYSLIFILLSYSFVIGRLSKHLSFLKIVGNIWFGFFQYALILLPIADIFIVILKMFMGPLDQAINFGTGIAIILLFIIIYGYGLFNAYSPIIRKYDISIPKRDGNRSTLSIAVASDMHFGRLSGVAHLKRLVKKVKSINPDLILLPGDIIDDELEPFIQKNMGSIMSELKAPLGVYGVLGNHEYYGGQIPQFIEQMKNINIKIMMDEFLTIEDSFHLLGRKDKTDKARMTFEELLSGIDRSYPIIAMDHQPSEIKQAQENGIDVLFSGHTHRGQMAPNHFITRKMYELDWGYLKKEQLHTFVSSGFGFWGPPMRIGSRSEILQIEITFK
ncbi:MAG TPA: metallophosphoesterase [Neobacillus sp.]